MKIPRIGDIIEINSKRGLAYAQYTHHHPEWNAVLRIFNGVFKSRPTDWAAIASLPVRFIVFFPLRSAVRQKAVAVVGSAPVDKNNIEFPVFRGGNKDMRTGKVYRWYLWKGGEYYSPDVPKSVLRTLSDFGSVDILFLEHLIDTEWSPEKEWDQCDASD